MTGLTWTFLIFFMLVVLAIAGSKLARRSLVVLVGIAACIAAVLWFFSPAPPL
jgi:hypothetical protein